MLELPRHSCENSPHEQRSNSTEPNVLPRDRLPTNDHRSSMGQSITSNSGSPVPSNIRMPRASRSSGYHGQCCHDHTIACSNSSSNQAIVFCHHWQARSRLAWLHFGGAERSRGNRVSRNRFPAYLIVSSIRCGISAFIDLPPTRMDVGQRVFAYVPRTFQAGPVCCSLAAFATCNTTFALTWNSKTRATPIAGHAREKLEVNVGDIVYTCTSYRFPGTNGGRRAASLKQQGERLMLQDALGQVSHRRSP